MAEISCPFIEGRFDWGRRRKIDLHSFVTAFLLKMFEPYREISGSIVAACPQDRNSRGLVYFPQLGAVAECGGGRRGSPMYGGGDRSDSSIMVRDFYLSPLQAS